MDALLLARLQFGLTTVYHFFFVPLTLGLVFLVAFLETKYVRTGDEKYKKLTKFWGHLFLINFAMGVATGIVQEFQFGMNWSEYSRFVGDIFGAPLAIEALLAFFLESTFLGIWIFGWDKLPKKIHAACIWVVAIGSSLSAFWILVASSFMHEPTGYHIINGRAEMTDFLALVTNPHLWLQFTHVMSASMLTGGFFMLGISAWHLMKNKNKNLAYFGYSFKIAAVYALVGGVLTATIGHMQAQHLVTHQPMKMAAAEALWEDADPAPFSLFTIADEKNGKNYLQLEVPALLSFLAFNKFSGEIRGINTLQAEAEQKFGPGDYVPPINITFWSFRIMVAIGGVLLILAGLATHLSFKNQPSKYPLLLKILPLVIILPYIANSAGWIFTEMGRQPWIVWEVLTVQDGLSPSVSAGTVLFSLISFTTLYGILMAVDIWLLTKYAKHHPEKLS